MSWKKSQEYGVVKIEGKNVKMYNDSQYYETVHVGESVRDARWAGDALIVTLENGKVRRYTSSQYYITV